jgi:hypothetical protein
MTDTDDVDETDAAARRVHAARASGSSTSDDNTCAAVQAPDVAQAEHTLGQAPR